MKIKVSASYSGVIATGSYENSRPGFSAEVEFDGEIDQVKDTQKILHNLCYENFKSLEDQFIIERIEKQRSDIRFYPLPNGKRVPSVTSIINFDSDMFVTAEELNQYACQSNLCHKQVENYISTGKWVEPMNIPECWPDLVVVRKGSLKLEEGGWDFEGFLKKYPVKGMKNASPSHNEEFMYGGTPDFIGIPDFDGAEKVPTIFDVKRTVDKTKNLKQMAAYSKMKGYEDIKQICIVPLNNKTQQGFSKPIVEVKIDGFFQLFLKDREAFRKRFTV